MSTTAFLGIIVDETLSWRGQRDWVSRKTNKSIGIRKVGHLVTINCLLTLYYSLIYPYLSYCNIVWESTYSTTLHKIWVLQKRYVRIATRSDLYTSSAPLFQKLQIHTIYDINIFQIGVFIYKIYSSEGNIPELKFKNYFTVNLDDVHPYSTHQSSVLHPPQFLTCSGQLSSIFSGPNI